MIDWWLVRTDRNIAGYGRLLRGEDVCLGGWVDFAQNEMMMLWGRFGVEMVQQIIR